MMSLVLTFHEEKVSSPNVFEFEFVLSFSSKSEPVIEKKVRMCERAHTNQSSSSIINNISSLIHHLSPLSIPHPTSIVACISDFAAYLR